MKATKEKSFFPVVVGTSKKISPKESLLLPWLFQNQDLINRLESSRPVDQKKLLNILNYLHFTDNYVFAFFKHPKYEEGILLKVNPEPCMGNKVTCRWLKEDLSELKLNDYLFQQLVITDGRSIILVPAVVQEINGECLTMQLPDTGYEVSQRKAKRHDCQDVSTEVIQSGFFTRGELIDFSPFAFRIRTDHDLSSPFSWFNLDAPATVHLWKDQQILFSGNCQCIRQVNYLSGKELVLAPQEDEIRRFKETKIQSPRYQLTPPPTVTFNHPFFKKKIQREIFDISNSGFSVYEKLDDGVLVPGLIIPELTINYSGTAMIKCKAQVIYRREKEERVLCGLVILDMDIKAYNKLTQILSHVADHYCYISNTVDMDELWEFFFDTGFIYPEKYNLIQSYREDFKETYRKLYLDNQDVAVPFTYEVDGQIYGHIAMIRAYEWAWLIHHYAARPMEGKLTGFLILKQIMGYMNGLYRLPSAKMDYVMTYFRPNNRIVDHVFGGFTRDLDDPRGCSLDLFSYVMFPNESMNAELPANWVLQECSNLDLWKLELFYKHHSGGLLIDALGLQEGNSNGESLEEIYDKLGFCRKCKIYSLKQKDNLAAVLIVNQSDMGINLSELLNGIKIIVIDEEHLPWSILSNAVSQLTGIYNIDKVPLLIYPSQYIEKENLPSEKQYQLWILNLHHSGNQYLEYMERKFRIRFR